MDTFGIIGGSLGRRTAVVGTVLGLCLAVGVRLLPVTAAEGNSVVKIANFSFAPDHVTVKVGSTVTWQNDDDIPHLVVVSNGAFRSKALDTNDKAMFTFRQPGEMPYFCGLHPQMKGVVTVVP